MLRPLLLALALATAARAGTLTVDDDGPADFATIQAAIDAAAPGDVILIAPGTYDAFVLDRSLSLLGTAGPEESRPDVLGASVVSGPRRCALAALHLTGLRIQDVPGPCVLEDCSLGGVQTSGTLPRALDILFAGQLHLVRTRVLPNDDYPGDELNGGGAFLFQTRGTITGGSFRGQHMSGFGDTGGHGIEAKTGALTLTEVTCKGGQPGVGPFGMGGQAGDGLHASYVFVDIRGGTYDGGNFDPQDGSAPGSAASVASDTLVVSGIEDTSDFGGNPAILADPPQPTLEPLGPARIGASTKLRLDGPAGESALLALSFFPDQVQLPGLEGVLWFSFSQPFVLRAVPADTSLIDLVVRDDPALVGRTLIAQVVFPDAPASFDPSQAPLTNPAVFVVRP